jgi:cellobiose phosphorylase
LFALNFYIQQTGDIQVLFEEIEYWKDQHIGRSQAIDEAWSTGEGTWQKSRSGEIYRGTILEHVLIQQLSAFYNVGEHNILKLEGADWNDTLDMARSRGESVCFQNFYAGNWGILTDLLKRIKSAGIKKISVLKEMEMLLDRTNGRKKVNYDSPEDKHKVLAQYFSAAGSKVTGVRKQIDIEQLIADLTDKYEHSSGIVRNQEWLETMDGDGYFNGHYDDLGCRMHGDFAEGPRMDLTSQVMPVMFDIADDDQVDKLYKAARKILGTEGEKGLRLCTRYPDIDLNIGRITGFVYGFKEHGSKWMQQNIMFMYGLLKRGKLVFAHEMLEDIFSISTNSSVAKTFPGIASYYEPGDRGAYMYLTGSSTWLFLSLVTQVFGVRGSYGNLIINPKLSDDFFDEKNECYVEFTFRRRRVGVNYRKPAGKTAAECRIINVTADGREVFRGSEYEIQIENTLIGSSRDGLFLINVSLG